MGADVIQATMHQTISPSASVLNPIPSGLYVATDGSVTIVMANPLGAETSITYPVSAGAFLPIRPLKITAATATVIGLY